MVEEIALAFPNIMEVGGLVVWADSPGWDVDKQASFNSKDGTRRNFQIQRPQPDAAAETRAGRQATSMAFTCEGPPPRAAPVARLPHTNSRQRVTTCLQSFGISRPWGMEVRDFLVQGFFSPKRDLS